MPETLSANMEVFSIVHRLKLPVTDSERRLYFASMFRLLEHLYSFPNIVFQVVVLALVAPVPARFNGYQIANIRPRKFNVYTFSCRFLSASCNAGNVYRQVFKESTE